MNNTSLPPDELLNRIATSLKREIGPAINEAYPKTQAFLAAVVLEKLAEQLKCEQEHKQKEYTEIATLSRDLKEVEKEDWPLELRHAITRVSKELNLISINFLITTLYEKRSAFEEEVFNTLLNRVRKFLRSRIDRAMEYSA